LHTPLAPQVSPAQQSLLVAHFWPEGWQPEAPPP
jgi:hypothetical protein